MKTKLLLLLLMICNFANAQNTTFLNDFESVTLPLGWTTNGFSRTTTQPCSGTASMASSAGQYAGGAIVSPTYLSDGQAISVSVKYKKFFDGIIYLQYSIDDINWVNIAVTNTGVNSCTLLSGTIVANVIAAGTNVRFRISTYNPGFITETYTIDDFQAVQADNNAAPLSEYNFISTMSNIVGTEPFSALNTGFTPDRNSVANNALKVFVATTGTTATISSIPTGNQSRTIAFWYNVNANTANSAIFSYGTAAANKTFGMYIQDTGRPVFQAYGTDAVFGTGSFASNTWHHAVLTYDGTNVRVYMNGVLQDTKPYTLNTGSSAIKFGNNSNTVSLDDLKIYNLALTDAQVLSLFNNNYSVIEAAPVVSNASASNATPVAATINYSVKANNATTTTTIKYGLSSTSLTTLIAGLVAAGNNLIPTSKVIPNLEPNTQYFYQIEVTNSVGTSQSAVLNFTTLVLPPAVAEYDFNNTYNNLNGSNPFTSGTGTSFLLGRDGTTQSGALKIQSFIPSATITGLPYDASPRTISLWAKTEFMFNGNNSMFSYGISGNNNGNTGSFEATQITYAANNNNVVVAATTQQDVWYYFTYVYDGVNAKIYRNGVLLASEPKSWNTLNNNDIFRLGVGSNNVGGFIGTFDDLKIYNYALSDNQITNLYVYNTLTIPTAILPVISAITSVPLTQTANITYTINVNYAPTTTIIKYGTSSTSLTSQIAGFSTNGNSTTNTSTISGLSPVTQYFYQIEATNSVGTVTSSIENFTTVASLPSVAAYSFNSTLNNTNGNAPFGSNSSWSYVADRNATASSALRINGSGSSTTITGLPTGNSPRTVSIWYKVASNSNDNCLFVYGQSGGQNAYGVSFNNSDTWYNFAWSTNTSFTNPSNDGTWHHLVTTFDASKTSKVYIDGVLKNTVVQNGWDTSVNNNTFWLGGLFSSTASTFNGTVDDLTIYNFALTDDQVLNLFNSPTLSSQDFNSNNLEVSLYPNPTNGILNIDMTTEIQSIEIYSIQGQKVLNATQKQVNVSHLASGMYLIRIQDGSNVVATKKFMKQ